LDIYLDSIMKDQAFYKLAKKLEPRYSNLGENIQFSKKFELFVTELGHFFDGLSEEDFFKLFIFCYFIWSVNPNYSLQEILSKLPDVGLLYSFEADFYPQRVECEQCDGSGDIDCENCEGGGMVECPDCDGAGVDDEGDTCAECNGAGEVECSWCNGRGAEDCGECEGFGEVESETVFSMPTFTSIFTNPNDLKYYSEALNDNEPITLKNIIMLNQSSSEVPLSFTLKNPGYYAAKIVISQKLMGNLIQDFYFKKSDINDYLRWNEHG
jgi:hypothetical protein